MLAMELQTELAGARLMSKHMELISFPPEQRGKTVYVAGEPEGHG
jgi:hypothetical protein